MNSSEAHAATVNKLLAEPLTQLILLDIETMADQGKFCTLFTTDVAVEKVQDIVVLLRDLGYSVSQSSEHFKRVLYINW